MTRKEIILPPHLYDRIKASAGEHGGIGMGRFFDGLAADGFYTQGAPFCVHGHAWGTRARASDALCGFDTVFLPPIGWQEPELQKYLTAAQNDGGPAGNGNLRRSSHPVR